MARVERVPSAGSSRSRPRCNSSAVNDGAGIMKYAIIIPDGCADEPIAALSGRTPLQAASTPHMDAIARGGRVGLSNNTPAHLPAGSEVANLSLFGYRPDDYFTGRAPLEAAAQGIELAPEDWAVRCNLVTIKNGVMVDFTADHIETDEATALLRALQEEIAPEGVEFVSGVSYRNLMLFRGTAGHPAPFDESTRTSAPHDFTDLEITPALPAGSGADLLKDLMLRSESIFVDHPVNAARRAAGKHPATGIWLWGQGRAPRMPSFKELFGLQGVMITAVDLLRGIAAIAGWPRIEVEGATGYLDTDYAAKGRAAVAALETYDLVCVHVESTDEASHEGRFDAKIEGLEEIDKHIVGPLREALGAYGEHRILVTPDHPTYCSTKKHTHGDVPYAMAGTEVPVDGGESYDEVAAASTGHRHADGTNLIREFIARG